MSQYTKEVLKVVVAKLCQTIGWHSIHSTPLEIMVDILRRYLSELAKLTHAYATQFGHTQPNLDELGLAFRDMHVNIADLEEYVRYVDSSPALQVPEFPVHKESHLNFLKPGSNEVVTRPVHIHEHLPPMFPETEESELTITNVKQEDVQSTGNMEISPAVFKRPADISPSEPMNKRPRLMMEEEGRPTREISSVMMTTSGFLSPAREGKLPEPRTPINTLDLPSSMSHNVASNTSNELRFERKIPKLIKEPKKNDKRREKSSKELFKPTFDEASSKKVSVKDVAKLKVTKANVANINMNTHAFDSVPAGKALNVKSTPGSVKSAKVQQKVTKTEKPFSLTPPAPVLQKSLPTPPPPMPPQTITTDKIVEGKLSSEPDKQKLNIFKKISKVKDDKIEKCKMKEDSVRTDDICVQESRESSPDLIIDEPILKNWDQSRTSCPKGIEIIPIKQEHFDKTKRIAPISVELAAKLYNVKSPHSDKDFLYDDDISPPGTPSTPKTPEMPSHSPPLKLDLKENKRKRKEKTKMKNKRPKICVSPRRGKIDNSETELDRPKTPNGPVSLVKEEPITAASPQPTVPPVFPFFTNFIPRPGLIPSPIMNPLFLPKHGFGQPAHMPATMPALPFVPTVKPPPAAEEFMEKTFALRPIGLECDPSDVPSVTVKEKHKKDKKDKIKKKNKKDKIKNKSEKRKLKEERKEKDKEKIKKEKKDKKKEKEREHEASVPKLTLKISSPRPPTPDAQIARKIMIKPVVKKEEEEPLQLSSSGSNAEVQEKRDPSPELARISALITRPPKLKTSTATILDNTSRISSSVHENLLPIIPTKLKKTMFRAHPKIKSRDLKSVWEPEEVNDCDTYISATPASTPEAFYIEAHGSKEESGNSQTSTSPKQSGPMPGRSSRINSNMNKNNLMASLSSVTVVGVKSVAGKSQKPVLFKQQSSVVDNEGNKVWICPACGGQDDGSPMIGCDDCDAWYHWVCVGIQVPPDQNEDWYCRVCIVKKQETLQMDKKKKRKKKEKKDH